MVSFFTGSYRLNMDGIPLFLYLFSVFLTKLLKLLLKFINIFNKKAIVLNLRMEACSVHLIYPILFVDLCQFFFFEMTLELTKMAPNRLFIPLCQKCTPNICCHNLPKEKLFVLSLYIGLFWN